MSEPSREEALAWARSEIISQYHKEYGLNPTEDEIEMELEDWCEAGFV